jgi:hypothetical protein
MRARKARVGLWVVQGLLVIEDDWQIPGRATNAQIFRGFREAQTVNNRGHGRDC